MGIVETFFFKLSEYGTGPLLICVIFAIGFLWKRVEKLSSDDKVRALKLQEFFEGVIKDLKKEFEERFSAQNRRIDNLSEKVGDIERDYIPRDEHYRDFSGWRTELADLRNLIVNLFKEQGKK